MGSRKLKIKKTDLYKVKEEKDMWVDFLENFYCDKSEAKV